MTLKQFTEKIHSLNNDLPKTKIRKIINDVFNTIKTEVLENDECIKIAKFGKFSKKEIKSKEVKFKDKVYQVPQITTIKFKSSNNI